MEPCRIPELGIQDLPGEECPGLVRIGDDIDQGVQVSKASAL